MVILAVLLSVFLYFFSWYRWFRLIRQMVSGKVEAKSGWWSIFSLLWVVLMILWLPISLTPSILPLAFLTGFFAPLLSFFAFSGSLSAVMAWLLMYEVSFYLGCSDVLTSKGSDKMDVSGTKK